MSRIPIKELACIGASEVLEFKRTTGKRRDAIRSLCAMLNHRGGRILFGVEPNSRVQGQQVSDHTLEQVTREIRELVKASNDAVVKEELALLRGLGLVEPRGHGRGAYWMLTAPASPRASGQ